jgi:Tol biopolymer transport system component
MPNDIHDDIRRLLTDAVADLPALAPAPQRTVRKARHRVTATVSALAVVVALAVGGLLAAARPFTRSMPANDGDDQQGTWIVDTDTGSATRLDGLPHGAFWFDAAQDGSTLAFAARSHGRTQVYLSAADGSDPHVVTNDRYEGSHPALSPDASMLAYTGFGDEESRNVFLQDLTTGRVRQLTHERHDVSELAWSPDGNSILYSISIRGLRSAKIFDPGASSLLKIVDVSTGIARTIAGTHRAAADFGAWSPDGRVIAYMTGHEWTDNSYGFDPAVIWVMGADGSSLRRVVTFDARAFGVTWTPDGNLAFSRLDGDVFNTYELDPENGQMTLLTSGFLPVWINDHTLIVER